MNAQAIGAWLVTSPSPAAVLGPVGALYLLAFGAGFVSTSYLVGPAATRFTSGPVQASLLKHRASVGMVVFGAGLFFLGMRLLQLDGLPFGWPIWLIASALAAALYLMQCWRWWRSARVISPLPAGHRVPSGCGVERG